jgi:predicted Zn-dependent protease
MARVVKASGDRTAARDGLALARRADPKWALPRVALAAVLLAGDEGAADAEAKLRYLAAASPASAAPLRRLARLYERAHDLVRAAEVEQAARAVERPRRALKRGG